jgi:hypothetical protein
MRKEPYTWSEPYKYIPWNVNEEIDLFEKTLVAEF